MTLPALVVSHSSPVSALVVMGCLDWLRRRWQVVHVPEMVWQELQRRSSPADWAALKEARSKDGCRW
jgi:hypothetical protein